MGTPQNSHELLRGLAERADQEKAAIRDQVHREIDLIHGETEKAVQALQVQAEQQAAHSLRRLRDRQLGQARTRVRQTLLRAKREAVDRAFEQAEERIRVLQASPDYEAVLTRLIRETVAQMGPGTTLDVASEDLAATQAIVKREGLACSVRQSPTDRGTLRFTSGDGQCTVDTGLLTRLTRARSRCSAAVAAVLFASKPAEEASRPS